MANEEGTKFKDTILGRIPKEWNICKLGDLSTDVSYGYTTSATKDRVGPKFLRITDIVHSSINWDKVPFCKIDNKEKYKLEEGDIVIARTGASTGSFALIDKDYNAVFASYLIRFKFDKSLISPLYVLYILHSQLWTNFISASIKGSAQPGINARELSEFMLPVPSLLEQQRIGNFLKSFDKKIELNQKMNKTLEAIAQAIFKHWFIDFEFPNEEGKPYKSSGGEMVDSELGEIPKGWEVKKITEIGRLKNGINYTRDEKGDEEFYIVNVRDISKSKFIIKDDLNVIKLDSTKCKDYLLNQNDIIIARSASPGESSLILGNIDNVIHSGFCIRYRLSNPNFKWYVYLLLQHSKNILFRYSIGTALKSLNQTAVGNMSIVMPSVDVLMKFNSIDIINKIMSNLLESKALLNIRDLLLPKLIMGKIRVPLEE